MMTHASVTRLPTARNPAATHHATHHGCRPFPGILRAIRIEAGGLHARRWPGGLPAVIVSDFGAGRCGILWKVSTIRHRHDAGRVPRRAPTATDGHRLRAIRGSAPAKTTRQPGPEPACAAVGDRGSAPLAAEVKRPCGAHTPNRSVVERVFARDQPPAASVRGPRGRNGGWNHERRGPFVPGGREGFFVGAARRGGSRRWASTGWASTTRGAVRRWHT